MYLCMVAVNLLVHHFASVKKKNTYVVSCILN